MKARSSRKRNTPQVGRPRTPPSGRAPILDPIDRVIRPERAARGPLPLRQAAARAASARANFAASSTAASSAPVAAIPLPDVEGCAVRRRGEDGVETSRRRHAAVEAFELGRDLSLVVVHRDHAVELAREGLDVDGIGRERAATVDTRLGGDSRDGRTDELDLLASEQPILSRVRVERRDGDPGLCDAGAAHRAVDEYDGVADGLRSDQVECLTQGDMGGDAGHPLAVEDVHFGEVAAVLEQGREHLVLVGIAPAALDHRGLVERGEGDTVHVPLPGHRNRMGQGVPGHLARGRRDLPARQRRRIVLPRSIRGTLGSTSRSRPRSRPGAKGRSRRHPASEVQHTGVADDDEARHGVDPSVAQGSRDDLGTDAGAIACGRARRGDCGVRERMGTVSRREGPRRLAPWRRTEERETGAPARPPPPRHRSPGAAR